VNRILEIIARAAGEGGVLSFAQFMDLALYCPVYGYYEKEADNLGCSGDFITSVSVGDIFGELLAFQFSEWIAGAAGRKGEAMIVEAGAHRGQLARDILTHLRLQRPAVYEALDYVIVEPSDRRKKWQEETLGDFENKARWISSLESLGERAMNGIIFSNELLDSMPVHRFGWDAANKEWFEWGVAVRAERVTWTKLPASNFRPHVHSALLEVLPEGFTIEVCPAAQEWWAKAARVLRSGRLLTLDYGLVSDELFAPERSEGTLRAYRKHHPCDDVLAAPGEQDITAHVNFTAVQEAGESAGLKTELFCAQEKFLTQIAARLWMDQKSGPSQAWGRRFQTLTHPEHFGRKFQVLMQSR
jgi:SAM-dependent MidA family methyltransferase